MMVGREGELWFWLWRKEDGVKKRDEIDGGVRWNGGVRGLVGYCSCSPLVLWVQGERESSGAGAGAGGGGSMEGGQSRGER